MPQRSRRTRWRQGLGGGPFVPPHKIAVEAASPAEESPQEEPKEELARPPGQDREDLRVLPEEGRGAQVEESPAGEFTRSAATTSGAQRAGASAAEMGPGGVLFASVGFVDAAPTACPDGLQ